MTNSIVSNKMRIAYFLTHPIQYQVPMIRHLLTGGVEIEVFYGSNIGAKASFDSGFGRVVHWDVPLLDGYPHSFLNEAEPSGSRRKQISFYQKQIHDLLSEGRHDVVWVHGWHHPLSAAAWIEAKIHRLPLILRGETFLGCVRGGWLKRLAHWFVFRHRFKGVAAFLTVGTKNSRFYKAYGVPEQRLFQMPYSVDNAFFQVRATEARSQSAALREKLSIAPESPIVLFCGKLVDVKDPATLIRAIGKLQTTANTNGSPPVLVLAGDGALRNDLESLATEVAPNCVKFLGFRNQTELPALYDLCDVFVLPSLFEPWGLVVNEVMNAGKAVIVSDQVGCGADLVSPGINGDIFKAGNVDDLAAKLTPYCQSAELRQRAGVESLAIIKRWSFNECLVGLQQALLSLANF